jgi:hypothetical protein
MVMMAMGGGKVVGFVQCHGSLSPSLSFFACVVDVDDGLRSWPLCPWISFLFSACYLSFF